MTKPLTSEHGPSTSLALALIEASCSPVLLLDEEGKICGASRSFCSAFGFELDEIEGRTLATIGDGEWDIPQLRSLLKSTFSATAAVDSYEIDLLRAGQDPLRLVLNAHLLDYVGSMPLVVLTVADVTSARLAERIKDDLIKEKAVLLMELQHRVANSLQIIASVLMQSARRVQSEETRTHLRNAQTRVLSIASLQKQLSQSSEDRVALRQYLESLCESIGASMIDSEEGTISLHVRVDNSTATASTSTSLGLIVTELVINALKHAFPLPDQKGEIEVSFRGVGDGFVLAVEDDGVGIAASDKPIKPGLGTGIVEALARQLEARVETTDAEPGTRVAIIKAG